MSVKFLVVVNDGKREQVYKGINAPDMSSALDIAVDKHLKQFPNVDREDIEATSCKMAQ